MDGSVSRRRLLAGLGAVGATALAGCSTAAGSDAARLAYLRVANWDDTEHTIHVLVERDGDIVHWSSTDLVGRGDEIPTRGLQQTWDGDGSEGELVVRVRVDDATSWKAFDLAAQDGDCYGVEARVNRDGGVGIWYEQAPSQCTSTPTESG